MAFVQEVWDEIGDRLQSVYADLKIVGIQREIGDFETQLKNHRFFRIQHHFLINLSRIREFQRHDGGYVLMENNNRLEVSQRKRKDFLDAIEDILL